MKRNKQMWRDDELYLLLDTITDRKDDKEYEQLVTNKLIERGRTLASILSTRTSIKLFFKSPKKLLNHNSKLFLFVNDVMHRKEIDKLNRKISYLEGMLKRQETRKNWLLSLFVR